MTVPLIVGQEQNRIDYAPDGIETTFAYDFEVDEETWMFVYADGEPYLEPFSMTGIGVVDGGDVIFDNPPSASIDVLTLIRIVPITQEKVYPTFGPFPAKSHEKALDKLTWIDQQQEETLARCWKNPVDGGVFDFTIEEPIADRILIWNGTADGIINGPDVVQIETWSDEAQAAAAAAAIDADRAEAAANEIAVQIYDAIVGVGGQTVFDLGFQVSASAPNLQFYADGVLMFDAFPCDAGGILVVSGNTRYVNAGGLLPEGTAVKVYSASTDAAANISGFINTFDNVAVLTAQTDLVVGSLYYTKGYYTPGDGGDATYLIVAGNSGDGYVNHNAGVNTLVLQHAGAVSVLQTGAVDSLVVNSTAAVQAAISHFRHVHLQGNFRLSSIVITSPTLLTGEPGTIIVPDMGLAGGKLFNALTDDFEVRGLTIDAEGETFLPATGNSYAFFSGDGTTKYKNHTYSDIAVRNFDFNDGNTSLTNLLVSHAFYIDNVDGVIVSKCRTDNVSGASVFCRDCEGLTIEHNTFSNNGWYVVQIAEGVRDYTVSHNRFLCNRTAGLYWGGAVNTTADAGLSKNRRGKIDFNYFEGKYSYGAIIRIQSSDDVIVENNHIAPYTSVGTWAPAEASLTGIRVSTRGVSSASKNEPCENVTIVGNIVHAAAGGTTRQAIYITNDFWLTRNPAKNVRVIRNVILSEDITNYWGTGISIHGLTGGFEDVRIVENYILSLAQSSSVVVGSVGVIGTSSEGAIDLLKIGGNTLVDLGTPLESYQVGLAIGANVDNVIQTEANKITGFYTGARTFTGSGPTLEDLDNQVFSGNTLDTLFQVALSKNARIKFTSVTFNPPSLAAGASTFADVSVPEAVVGDIVVVSFPVGASQISVTAQVRVATSVRVLFDNQGSTTVDLASGNLKVGILR